MSKDSFNNLNSFMIGVPGSGKSFPAKKAISKTEENVLPVAHFETDIEDEESEE